MSSSKLFLILVGVDLETFSILPPYVLGSRSIPVPMPTTLVGALVYPILIDKYGTKELNPDVIYNEANNLGIRYVTFRAAPYVTTIMLERAVSITYQRRQRLSMLKYINKCLDVISIAVNYGLTHPMKSKKKNQNENEVRNDENKDEKDEIELLKKLVERHLGRSPDETCIELLAEGIYDILFTVTSRGITIFGDTSYIAYVVSNKELVKYAWQIIRIGRKEDLAVVRDVKVLALNELKQSEKITINTRFYVLKGLVKDEPSNATLWNMMVYLNGKVIEDGVYVPRGILNAQFTVDPSKSIIYEVNIDEARDYVIIPREVVENA